MWPAIEMPERHRPQRPGEAADQQPGALIGLLGAFREHRAPVLVDDLDVETLLGLLDDDVLGDLADLRHVLQRLPQRGGGQREVAVVVEFAAVGLLAAALVFGRIGGRLLGRDRRRVLELGPRREAGHFDDAGIADTILHAERVAHGAGDDLQLRGILGRERHQHHEEADQQRHQVGKGDEPPVSAVCPSLRRAIAMSAAERRVDARPARPPALPGGDASRAGRPAASRVPASGSWPRGSS